MLPEQTTAINQCLRDKKIALIVSRYHADIATGLIQGAKKALALARVEEKDIFLVWAPGTFEIPFAAQCVLEEKNMHGIVTLGVVIQGETWHHQYIASECARGIATLSLNYKIPIGYGVLTVKNKKQALARAAADQYNKGFEAAKAVIELVTLQNTKK